MQIVVLAGGIATRMRPITEKIPKALIEVNGKPFVQHQIELFKKNGITDIVICIGYKGQQIIDYFGYGSRFGVKIQYSDEGENLMGTAGALKKAENLLEDTFFVINGDSYLTIDYSAVMEHFNQQNKSALVTAYKNDLNYHKSNFKVEDGLIVKYEKKNPTPDIKHVDYGLSIFKKSLIQQIPENTVVQMEDFLQGLIEKRELLAYEVSERFYEIGEPEGLRQLEEYLSTS